MTEKILIEDRTLREKLRIFQDRYDGGRHLSSLLENIVHGNEIVLAIPSGGVPVAAVIARNLSLPLDLVIVRKIQIPWNTEAGFGAVDPDGVEIFNEALLKQLGLSEREIAVHVEKTRSVIQQRNSAFRKDKQMPDLTGRRVIIVDDGLASGYTMISAVRFVRRKNPEHIIAAVPTANGKTAQEVLRVADVLVCPNVRTGFTFAVADAYRNWHDLSDGEVLSIIGENSIAG